MTKPHRIRFPLGQIVATRAYRLRLLNGSNSRIYKLAWRAGRPLTVIATGGGLLEQPVLRPFVMLAPGERAELWADFTGRRPGDELFLDSQEFVGVEGDDLTTGAGGMGGMMMSTAALPNGAHGVVIQNGAKNNLVGTDGDGQGDAVEGNLISGNAGYGIDVYANGSQATIVGNKIGSDVTGTQALGNTGIGILVAQQASATIGGTAASDGNLVVGTAKPLSPAAYTQGEGIRLDS